MRSIRRALFVPLAAGLAIAVIVAVVGTYYRAREEANALLDVQLTHMAASVTGMPLASPAAALPGPDRDAPLVVQVWDRDGVQVYRSQARSEAPRRSAPGFATVETRDGPWRVFSVLAGERLVQVGQPLSVRNEIAAGMALRTTLPLLIVVPLVALVLWFVIHRALQPLDRVAAAVGKRTPPQLAPLAATGWPREVEPLVGALNGLLARLAAALDAQRAFVADAAHELRTPLAAVSLQAQLAERAATPEERTAALATLRAGLERATRMVEQLLALAREEHKSTADAEAVVDLAALARDVVAELTPLAAAKDVDLGVEGGASALIRGDPAALRTLLANLIDNAVRYTPSGGRADVGIEQRGAGVVLAVRDNGPGIAPSERSRLFDRFVRGSAANAPGSGLGLAIVKRIAERHGATVALEDGLDGRGLGVAVSFPAAGPPLPMRS